MQMCGYAARAVLAVLLCVAVLWDCAGEEGAHHNILPAQSGCAQPVLGLDCLCQVCHPGQGGFQ